MKESNKPYIVTNPQIEEMAKVIEITEQIARDAHCELPSPRMYATDLYRKGWRKQSKGEWQLVGYGNGRPIGWKCSACGGMVYDASNGNTDFCPNCGANMEGGVQE